MEQAYLFYYGNEKENVEEQFEKISKRKILVKRILGFTLRGNYVIKVIEEA